MTTANEPSDRAGRRRRDPRHAHLGNHAPNGRRARRLREGPRCRIANINGAKAEATRSRRIDKAVALFLAGKPR